jgi:GAF domain-containing protein
LVVGGTETRALDRILRQEDRLRAVHSAGLLNARPDPALDRVTRMAARALACPIALLSFFDEARKLVKSSYGLKQPWPPGLSSGIAGSRTAELLLSGKVLAISEIQDHVPVRDDVVARHYGGVAYVGTPILAHNGLVLGALELWCRVGRLWSAFELDTLRDHASCILSEIELASLRRAGVASLAEAAPPGG